MSKLDDICRNNLIDVDQHGYVEGEDDVVLKNRIKDLMLELIGDVEQRETEDVSLNSWTHDDYKAFGKNELKLEQRRKVEEL